MKDYLDFAKKLWNNGSPYSENSIDKERHPEDITNEEDSCYEARKRIKEFVTKHQAELACLVLIYSDAEAQTLLEQLREEFWANTSTLSFSSETTNSIVINRD